MDRKKVVLLGSTGSIGTSTLKVATGIPERMELIALAGGSRVQELAAQVHATGVKHVGIYDTSKVDQLKQAVPSDVMVYAGAEGLLELATLSDADMVLVAIVGTAGLHPALAAVEAGKELAVASKEILVMAGEIVMTAAKEKGVDILPVDSEHNAIFQCLDGHRNGEKEISRLILTASGGPFRQLPSEQLADVSVQQALKHPTWDMGRKITIDSATLFNKGLEMIEAKWLFNVEMDQVDVIVHPQSIIHSMVEFVDHSVLAQLSTTDMCFPIQYAVTWPERLAGGLKPLNFAELAKLEFEAPRIGDFPALRLAREAGTKGGTLPAVLNAANEIAVDAFCARQIRFPQIWETVEHAMQTHEWNPGSTLDSLIAADADARHLANKYIQSLTCSA